MQCLRDSQKMFLQSFMSKGILNTKEVKSLYHLACTRYDENADPAGLAHFVVTIGQQLKPFNLEIKKGISEDNGSSHYVLVNTVCNDITLKALDYASHELEYFKKLVEAVVNADGGVVSSIEALNLVDAVKEKKMRKDDAERLLKRFEEDKWLVQSSGSVSLSTRSIMELENYIFEQYEGLAVKCEMCKKICLKGQNCESCDVKLHLHCATKLFEKQSTPKCPGQSCKVTWPHELPRKKTKEAASSASTEDVDTEERPKQKRRK